MVQLAVGVFFNVKLVIVDRETFCIRFERRRIGFRTRKCYCNIIRMFKCSFFESIPKTSSSS